MVIQLSSDGIREIRQALASAPPDDGAEVLTASLPAGPALWRVPESAEHLARRHLAAVDEVARGLRLAAILAQRTDPPGLLRPWLARRLFDDWNPTTNPELLTAQWNSLNPEDRRFWTDRAQQYLNSSRSDRKEV